MDKSPAIGGVFVLDGMARGLHGEQTGNKFFRDLQCGQACRRPRRTCRGPTDYARRAAGSARAAESIADVLSASRVQAHASIADSRNRRYLPSRKWGMRPAAGGGEGGTWLTDTAVGAQASFPFGT
jgi:hypothetical protein